MSLGVVEASDYVTTMPWVVVTWEQDGQVFEYWVLKFDDGSGHVIMLLDRNLWATMTWEWPNANTGSYGYHYQWWNNHGFESCYSNECDSFPWWETTWNQQVDVSSYLTNPSTYDSGIFIMWNNNRTKNNSDRNLRWWDWDSQYNNWRWVNRLTAKNLIDRKWPCPEWYHVPSIWEWDMLLKYRVASYTWEGNTISERYSVNGGLMWFYSDDIAASHFYSDFKIPFAGYRDRMNADIKSQGTVAEFHSSSHLTDSYYTPYFFLGWAYARWNSYGITPNGLSVRCFYNLTKTLTFLVDGEVIKVEKYVPWEKIYFGPNIPEKENSEFVGRFKDDSNEVFKIGTDTIYEDTILNAKYKCKVWYVKNEEDICEKIKVEFNANWWNFGDWSMKIIESNIENNPIKIINYSHTPNIDDEWNLINYYGINDKFNFNDVIILTWATNLHITIRWSFLLFYGALKQDFVSIRTWNHPDYTANDNYSTSITNKLGWYSSPYLTAEYEINGDTVTFACITTSSGGPWTAYWYYAVIEWTWNDFSVIYPEDAFDNITQPSRNGYKFAWWHLSDGTEFNTWNISTWTVTKVYAKWEKIWSSGWWGWGGWWGWSNATPMDEQKPAETPKDQTSSWTTVKEPENATRNNAEIQTWSQANPQEVEQISEETPQNSSNAQDSQQTEQASDKSTSEWHNNWKDNGSSNSFTKEQKDAYEFTKRNWITTTQNIQQAQMNWKLTRIQMAKMLSQYAVNVLWMEPDISKWIADFSDVTRKMNKDYNDGVTLAYQLWIMWQNMPNNKFRPNDEVSRAEFVTALSRLLYSTSDGKYESTPQYYVNHMEKLKWEWIITKADPKMKELRGYVMIMLMRSVK